MAETQAEPQIDRSAWGPGPWDGEPDRVEFEAHGLPCLVQRTRMGHLCGYVAVPPKHPAHGIDYQYLDVEAHGGLTFAGKCSGLICHVPKPGAPANVWWFGFDCAHSGDLSPGLQATLRGLPDLQPEPEWPLLLRDVYRTVDFAQAHCIVLALQLRDLQRSKRRRLEKKRLRRAKRLAYRDWKRQRDDSQLWELAAHCPWLVGNMRRREIRLPADQKPAEGASDL